MKHLFTAAELATFEYNARLAILAGVWRVVFEDNGCALYSTHNNPDKPLVFDAKPPAEIVAFAIDQRYAPPYEDYLQNALTLAPQGAYVTLKGHVGGTWSAAIVQNGYGGMSESCANPARAVCEALEHYWKRLHLIYRDEQKRKKAGLVFQFESWMQTRGATEK